MIFLVFGVDLIARGTELRLMNDYIYLQTKEEQMLCNSLLRGLGQIVLQSA